MLTTDLRGKRALVTGGISGIGRAAVELLAQCGARVAVNHLADDARAPGVLDELRGRGFDVIVAAGNVSVPGEAEAMVKTAIGDLGGLDILINNAGTPATVAPIAFDDLDRMDEAFWQTILATNLVGPFRCAHAAAAALKATQGAIVSTASVAGLDQAGSSIAYGASKAGLINLTKSLARALAPDVRVNAVAPGLVDSPWTKDWPAERKASHAGRTLLRRMVKPEEIAQAMLFLAVHPMVTGQTLVVDGGLI